MKKKEDIRNKFEDYILDYEAKIRLWSNVKRVTKKDGSDFQSFAKNFANAKIERGRICSDDFEICVSDYSIRIDGKYVCDSISIKQVVKYSRIIPAEDQIIKESFYEPYFYMTPAQVMEYIQITIDRYKEKIVEYQEQLAKLDALYDYVKSSVDSIMDKVRKEAGSNTSLYYEMRGLLKEVGY